MRHLCDRPFMAQCGACGPFVRGPVAYLFVIATVQTAARVTSVVPTELRALALVPTHTRPVLPAGFAIPLPRAATLKDIVMTAPRFLTSLMAALAVVGAVGWAFAQTTTEPMTGAQPTPTVPADGSAATPMAPDATMPDAGANEPPLQADRN
jgi:hypothetical protein